MKYLKIKSGLHEKHSRKGRLVEELTIVICGLKMKFKGDLWKLLAIMS